MESIQDASYISNGFAIFPSIVGAGFIVDDRKQASAPRRVLMPLVMRQLQLALHQTTISGSLTGNSDKDQNLVFGRLG